MEFERGGKVLTMKDNPRIMIFGAGAIGSTIGAWVASGYDNVFLYDKPEILEVLKSRGLTAYVEGKKDKAEKVRVKVIEDLSKAEPPDVIALVVKNYSLDAVSSMLKERFGDEPVVIGFQNGIENQKILPRYFSKVLYGIVSYNAWLDEPGVVGYQKRGPLILGTAAVELKPEMDAIAHIFSRGVETVATEHLQDAARCKMVVNLTNSLTTLIGHRYREISDPELFQRILTNLTYEGVRLIRYAGYNECKLGGMPSWMVITAGAVLPQFITRGMFEKNVKKMVLSSMAQDIIQRGGSDSELETINGYFIELADKYGFKAPYNRAVYELCRQEFNRPKFEPIDVKEVWERVLEKM
jgi:2-dehydropantoate 2-reductase